MSVERGEKEPIRVKKRKEPTKRLRPSPRSKVEYDLTDTETIRKRRDTANRVFNDLWALLTLAYKDSHVVSKAAWEKVDKFEKIGKAKNEYLGLEEAKRFLEACPQDFKDFCAGSSDDRVSVW